LTSSPCRESLLYQANEAIIREIATRGDKSRFRKTERGKFELAK
jgi:hypothetical protein